METVMFEGELLPRDCLICGSKLDYEAAERDQGDSFALAEAYDPTGYDEFQKFWAEPFNHPHDDRSPYELWEEKGKAGVVHASCMNDSGWELA